MPTGAASTAGDGAAPPSNWYRRRLGLGNLVLMPTSDAMWRKPSSVSLQKSGARALFSSTHPWLHMLELWNLWDPTTVKNATRDLAFADEFISAKLVENVVDYDVSDAVVVNLGPSPMVTGTEHPAIVPAWKSTWLKGGRIKSAERAALIKVVKATNLGGAQFRGWDWLGNRIRSFPRDTPLFISAQDEIGQVRVDPRVFTNETAESIAEQTFTLKLNLWWSPGDTDCFIHNEHPFLEVHTQIHGLGRMQKFAERDQLTLYEDVVMPIGYSHDPFCRVTGYNQWTYPWHRYYADTDSVWLAVELHP